MTEIIGNFAQFTFGRWFKIFLSFGWRRLVAGILFDLPLILLVLFFMHRSEANISSDNVLLYSGVLFFLLFVRLVVDILISIVIMKMVLQLSYSDFSIALIPPEGLKTNTVNAPDRSEAVKYADKVEVTYTRTLKVWWSIIWRGALIGLFFVPFYLVLKKMHLSQRPLDVLIIILSPVIFYYIFAAILKLNYSDFSVRILKKG